ncbi:MAG: hypothetical protein ABIQ88_19640 [Chitinophagaceae bacterium]
MGLSKHDDGHSGVMEDLALLDDELVLLEGMLIKPSQCFRLSGNPPQIIYNTNCPADLKAKVNAILLKHRSRPSGISYFYTVEFDHEGVHYIGRLTPEFKRGGNEPSSWHTVLNDVFFGYLHCHNSQWEVSEQRPQQLVDTIGKLIDNCSYQALRIVT